MYYIDTPLARVDVFDYDAASSAITNRRTLFEVPKENGAPDGMTIDEDGLPLGCALGRKRGASLHHQGCGGSDDRLPAARVTSCTFGGSDLRDLYITTASTGLTAEQQREQPTPVEFS